MIEEALEGVHAQRQALGIIQAVDADDHRAAGEAVEHAAHEGGADGAAREAAELGSFDADRESADAHRALARAEGALVAARETALLRQIAREVVGIAVGLEADE